MDEESHYHIAIIVHKQLHSFKKIQSFRDPSILLCACGCLSLIWISGKLVNPRALFYSSLVLTTMGITGGSSTWFSRSDVVEFSGEFMPLSVP
jgi:hypothetical protein